MGISKRHRQTLVSQHLSDKLDVSRLFENGCRRVVSKCMRADLLGEPSLDGQPM